MVTTSIEIKPHLAEYAKAIYSVHGENYIQISHRDDLYHLLANLMQKRPENRPIRKGNLDIALPSQSGGKDAIIYNYISDRSTKIFEKRLEALFWAHLHEFVDEFHHVEGLAINASIHLFMLKFKIESISEDALSKNYYRWRWSVRRRRKKRAYNAS